MPKPVSQHKDKNKVADKDTENVTNTDKDKDNDGSMICKWIKVKAIKDESKDKDTKTMSSQ